MIGLAGNFIPRPKAKSIIEKANLEEKKESIFTFFYLQILYS